MDTSEKTLQLISDAGYKLTHTRRTILHSLTARPVPIQEIFETLQKTKKDIDLVTVYRTLELFTKLGFVTKILFGDKVTRYELVKSGDHHHHLVCESCGSVEDVPLNEKTLVKQVQVQSKFKVERHNLEFFGICAKCQ